MSKRNKTIRLKNLNIDLLTAQMIGNREIYNLDCVDYLRSLNNEPQFDLIVADPPYNMVKKFGTNKFTKLSGNLYEEFLHSFLSLCAGVLNPTGSIYVCCEWECAHNVYSVLSKYFVVRNRITWEREKGRGSLKNWKNASEDIFFATKTDQYTFNVDAVKLRRKVIAPYTVNSQPKDWDSETKTRLTFPSNLWTDIVVPFWSMPENTEHPTQKPEKLIAKIILASTNENDKVLDLFSGSGTTSVVAKKLNRQFVAVESDLNWCNVIQHRLNNANSNKSIQGYENGEFLHRNNGEK